MQFELAHTVGRLSCDILTLSDSLTFPLQILDIITNDPSLVQGMP